MNKNAKKWVKVLRNGRYKQTQGVLKDNVGYCCLGVACDLYGKEKNIKWKYDVFLTQTQGLPSLVKEWLGLTTCIGDYEESSLANENDDMVSFKRIAKIIESEPEGLFIK